MSKPLRVTTGVPQGSVLISFLFLIYYNDLPDCPGNNTQIAMFADDTSLAKAGICKDSHLQEDIDEMAVWLTSNRLTVNAPKCEVMNFGL